MRLELSEKGAFRPEMDLSGSHTGCPGGSFGNRRSGNNVCRRPLEERGKVDPGQVGRTGGRVVPAFFPVPDSPVDHTSSIDRLLLPDLHSSLRGDLDRRPPEGRRDHTPGAGAERPRRRDGYRQRAATSGRSTLGTATGCTSSGSPPLGRRPRDASSCP